MARKKKEIEDKELTLEEAQNVIRRWRLNSTLSSMVARSPKRLRRRSERKMQPCIPRYSVFESETFERRSTDLSRTKSDVWASPRG